jgi:hypothetical protein
VLAEELLEQCASIAYHAAQHPDGKLTCPVADCLGETKDGRNMQRHFWDLHPRDTVTVPKEGRSYPRCGHCGMQVNPQYTGHWKTESCSIGVERLTQPKAAIDSAIALRCNVKVHGEVLEKVEVFKYLGHLLAQDDDNVQAVRLQIRKAWGVWARVSQVLRAENTAPRVAAKFYKAVVQSVLLYGSKRWNLSRAVLAQLEGFHVRAAYKMARKNKPRKGLFGKWE